MRLVIVESPFAGDVDRNRRYLRACLRDCLLRGEAPYASHAIYTQPGVLDDGDAAERKLGIEAGFRFRRHADATVVYQDLGHSTSMRYGVEAAERLRAAQAVIYDEVPHQIEYRTLGANWEEKAKIVESSFITKWPGGTL